MLFGIYNYYAKFVIQYADITTPLYNLLWKNTKLDWTTVCDTAFNQLKHALVHAPVLAMPDFDADFVVETDASNIAVGVVLMQHNQLVAFMSKALNYAQCNYHTTDCKLLAIVHACKRWCHYLDGKKTVVMIDHRPLIRLHAAPNLNKR